MFATSLVERARRRRRAALVLSATVALAVSGCDSKSRGPRENAASTDTDQVAASAEHHPRPKPPAKAKPPKASDLARFTAGIEGNGELHAAIKTTMGTIDCKLYEKRAPLTVANFVGLARGKKAWVDPETGELRRNTPYYDGVIFHRVIPNFLIQTGDRTGTGAGGPGYAIPDEFDPTLHHDRAGILSMANKGRPDSAGSQWFITLAPVPHLDQRHAIFGSCDDLNVVKSIATVPTGPDNRPKKPPRIVHIRFRRAPKAAEDE